jgi:hypothetical protein
LPARGFSFYRKQVPKGTKNLYEQVNQQSERYADDIILDFH